MVKWKHLSHTMSSAINSIGTINTNYYDKLIKDGEQLIRDRKGQGLGKGERGAASGKNEWMLEVKYRSESETRGRVQPSVPRG